ncbi:EamA family transporter [Sanguibacter antarcticus]|uniref:Inner membrane transporter RhtA n=1 Tax=Sanguibacter antarcticus TaxID=372484 RepID=A0A2A9E895_9MICO|nr:EamA family transporter [Sanguibacter antarcticus]PFG35084.1 inner membrane transporter RhtA [Sanguibacter antarcticus]
MHRVPAPLLFLVSGVTQYVGAGLAVGLFTVVPATAVAWSRIAVAAVVLLVWSRPWARRWDGPTLRAAVLFGVVLAAMNCTFYASLDYLPLGNAVAIEFVGPVLVGALTGRGVRERVAIGLSLVGVVLLAGVTVTSGDDGAVLGIVLVLAAAACWAGYILLGRVVSQQGTGLAPLAVGMAAGAVVFAPFFGPSSTPLFTDGGYLAVLVGIALASSVVPYGIDQVVLRRLRPAQFSILLAIWPASALLVGAVMLRQVPHGLEVVGLVLVSVAIALTGRPQAPTTDPTADPAPGAPGASEPAA